MVGRVHKSCHPACNLIVLVCERQLISDLDSEIVRKVAVKPHSVAVIVKALSVNHMHARDILTLDKIRLKDNVLIIFQIGIDNQCALCILHAVRGKNILHVLIGKILPKHPQILQIILLIVSLSTVVHTIHVSMDSRKNEHTEEGHYKYSDKRREIPPYIPHHLFSKHYHSTSSIFFGEGLSTTDLIFPFFTRTTMSAMSAIRLL